MRKVEDGYLFQIFTHIRHDGRVFDTDFEVWASRKLEPIMSLSQRGDIVEIEGPLSRNKRIIITDFINCSLEQKRIHGLVGIRASSL